MKLFSNFTSTSIARIYGGYYLSEVAVQQAICGSRVSNATCDEWRACCKAVNSSQPGEESSNEALDERFSTRLFDLRTMARRTLLWCRLVEEYLLTVNKLHALVTSITSHISVFTLQWKRCTRVVIENRRLPFGTVVTTRTLCDLS